MCDFTTLHAIADLITVVIQLLEWFGHFLVVGYYKYCCYEHSDFWCGYGFFNRVIRVRLIKKGTFKQRLEGSREMSHGNLREERSSQRGHSWGESVPECEEDREEVQVPGVSDEGVGVENILFPLKYLSDLPFLSSASIVSQELGPPPSSHALLHCLLNWLWISLWSCMLK